MELIKRILIGKVFTFGFKEQFVIVGVRKNSLHGYLEVLAGKLYEYTNVVYKGDNGIVRGEIQIYS